MGIRLLGRRARVRAGTACILFLAVLAPSSAEAAIAFVQKASSVTDGGTSVTATFPATPTEGNVLVAIAGNRDARPDPLVPPGWNLVLSGAGNTPGQNIYYKVATAFESSSVTIGPYASATRLGLQIYEYSGLDASGPVDATGTASGSGTNVSSGSASTTNADDLLLAGVVINSQSTFSAWTTSFVEQLDFQNGMTLSLRSSYGGADRIVDATGTYSTTANASASGAWRGQIVAFKAPPPLLSLPLYLKGDTYPSAPLTEVYPTATVLPNYDPARDADPGLLVARGGTGVDEADPAQYQIWITEGRGIYVFGDVSLVVWSAIEQFRTGEFGRVDAYLLDCAVGGGNCTTIASGSLELADWSGGVPSWQERTVSFGPVSYNVLEGRALAVKVIVHDSSVSGLMFAYDTVDYPSRLVYGSRTISGTVFEDADFAGTATGYDAPGGDLPLPSVDVELYTSAGVYLSSAVTDAAGRYALFAPGGGTYRVRARSATIGDADTPPAGGLRPGVPGTWPYPLPEMTWGNGAPRYGGEDPEADDSNTADNAGPGDTWVEVTLSGGEAAGVDLGFAYNLIVHTLDDALADNVRSRQGGLRQFLKNANAIGSAGTTTANESQFRMQVPANGSSGGDSWWRISALRALPALNDAGTVVDGATQTASGGDSNARGPEIEIHGAAAGSVHGLAVTSSNNRIRGLAVNGFAQDVHAAIFVQGPASTGNRITGCHVGTSATGDSRADNLYGIWVENGAAGTVIGGPVAGDGNLLSGNTSYGVYLRLAGVGTVIQGNRIGTDAAGGAAVRNGTGIALQDSAEIAVGGAAAGEGNLISGNLLAGILVQASSDVTILGNRIGVDATGTAKLPNGGYGINGTETSHAVVVGGSEPGAGNVISGNDGRGIGLYQGANDWTIHGNRIGVGPVGVETDLGNGTEGIGLSVNPIEMRIRIGGENAGEGNVIAWSGEAGVNCPGLGWAVEIVGNVIRNNVGGGISLRTDDTTVARNAVHDNGAGFDGIALNADAENAKVFHNTVHGNGGDGVEVLGAGHTIRNNLFTGNAGYGINLNGGTMTESHNDATGAATNPPNALGRSNVALDATDLDADPLYVNAAAGDFRLTECTSPAINAGLDLGADQPDMNGADPGLYYGPAPDMGAYETPCLTVTVPLAIVKRAFLPDGTPIPSGTVMPRGTTFHYLLYINNRDAAVNDVSVLDVLDPAFAYSPGTIRTDASVPACAAAACTPAEEGSIFAAVSARPPNTDAVDADEVSYTAGTTTVEAGSRISANARLDIPAGSVWAMLFTVRML